MTANLAKVEIEGQKYPVRATFGALAEIEAHFEIDSITEINKVFSESFSAQKLVDLMEILLRSGGNENAKELAPKCDMAVLQEAMKHVFLSMGLTQEEIQEEVDPQPQARPKKAPSKKTRASRSAGKKR